MVGVFSWCLFCVLFFIPSLHLSSSIIYFLSFSSPPSFPLITYCSSVCSSPLSVPPLLLLLSFLSPPLFPLSAYFSPVFSSLHLLLTVLSTFLSLFFYHFHLTTTENQKEVDSLMATFVSMVTQRTMSPQCRDAIIELIIKNVPYDRLNWGDKFIRMGGASWIIFVLFIYYFLFLLSICLFI